MTTEEALQALKEARANREGWLRIAEILERVRASGTGGKPGKLSGDFVEEAAQACRYAPGILRRMAAARAFLLDVDRRQPDFHLAERLGGSTAMFSKVELLARLHKAAPEKALEIVGGLADGSITTRQLDRIYRDARGFPATPEPEVNPFGAEMFAARPAGRKPRKFFASLFHEACWEALKKDVAKLSGEGDVRLSCDYRFTYFTPFAVAVGVKDFGIEFVDGFYAADLPANPSQAAVNRVLMEVAFQAPFFRRFWVLVPSIETVATVLSAELTTIGLTTIGCAELKNGILAAKRKATASTSTRQQCSLALEILEMGVPQERAETP